VHGSESRAVSAQGKQEKARKKKEKKKGKKKKEKRNINLTKPASKSKFVRIPTLYSPFALHLPEGIC